MPRWLGLVLVSSEVSGRCHSGCHGRCQLCCDSIGESTYDEGDMRTVSVSDEDMTVSSCDSSTSGGGVLGDGLSLVVVLEVVVVVGCCLLLCGLVICVMLRDKCTSSG